MTGDEADSDSTYTGEVNQNATIGLAIGATVIVAFYVQEGMWGLPVKAGVILASIGVPCLGFAYAIMGAHEAVNAPPKKLMNSAWPALLLVGQVTSAGAILSFFWAAWLVAGAIATVFFVVGMLAWFASGYELWQKADESNSGSVTNDNESTQGPVGSER